MSVQAEETLLDEEEIEIVERAAEKGKYGSSKEFIREGALRLADEVLDEASFYGAVEMSDDIDELAETLGWHEQDRLEEIVQTLDVEVSA